MSESMKQAGGGRTAPAGTTSGRLFALGDSCFLADAFWWRFPSIVLFTGLPKKLQRAADYPALLLGRQVDPL